MSTTARPRPFPRIGRLVQAPTCTSNDRVVDASLRGRLLSEPVVVEEKLDGANVSIWLDAYGWPDAALRSGRTRADRGGHLRRIRPWLDHHAARVQELLHDGETLYAEWLLRTHTVRYAALPSHLIALDIGLADGSFATPAERDERCARAGVSLPPVVFRGILGTTERLAALHSQSAFGPQPAEGLVVRLVNSTDPLDRAKWIAPGFQQRTDESWASEPYRENTLASS